MFTMMRWHLAHNTQACTLKVKVTKRSKAEMRNNASPNSQVTGHTCSPWWGDMWRTRQRPVTGRSRSHLQVKGRNEKSLIGLYLKCMQCIAVFVNKCTYNTQCVDFLLGHLLQKNFLKTFGKWEIAHNEQFHILPQCFQLYSMIHSFSIIVLVCCRFFVCGKGSLNIDTHLPSDVLAYSHIQTLSDTFVADNFWTYCVKRRTFSLCHNVFYFIQ